MASETFAPAAPEPTQRRFQTRLFAVVIIVFGVLAAVVPRFTKCAMDMPSGTMAEMSGPMRCAWTAAAELVPGAILALSGILLFAVRGKEARGSLSIVAIAAGIAVILIPAPLIGTCEDAGARCRLLLKPSEILLGAFAIAVSALSLVASIRAKGESR